MNGVRIAVIGAGHWHMERQVDAFQAAGGTIVGVQQSPEGVAVRWGERLGCPAFSDVNTMLRTVRPALVLAMPVHAETPRVLSDLIERRIPFMVEKPAAANASDLWPVVRAAETVGLFTAVAFVNRYGGFWSELERLRSTGAMQHIDSARFRIINGTPQRYRDDHVEWVLDPHLSGGGALRNLGSHAADAVLQLASGDWQVVGAITSQQRYSLAVDEYAVAVLRGMNGMVITIEAGYTLPTRDGTEHEWTVTGADGLLTETAHDLTYVAGEIATQLPTATVAERYRLFAADVLQRLQSGRPSLTPLRAAAAASTLIDSIYQSANETPALTGAVAAVHHPSPTH